MVNKKPNNEEGIKALAEAMKNGGVLLNASCPVCNYPLIKINEKIFCKICNSQVIIYRDENELPIEYQKMLKGKETPTSPQNISTMKTINDKIEKLRKQLEKTDDPDEIGKITEAIDKLLNTLQKLKEKS